MNGVISSISLKQPVVLGIVLVIFFLRENRGGRGQKRYATPIVGSCLNVVSQLAVLSWRRGLSKYYGLRPSGFVSISVRMSVCMTVRNHFVKNNDNPRFLDVYSNQS